MLSYFNLLLYIPYIMQVQILNYMISPFCIKLREHKIANPDDHGLIFLIFKPHDLLEVFSSLEKSMIFVQYFCPIQQIIKTNSY